MLGTLWVIIHPENKPTGRICVLLCLSVHWLDACQQTFIHNLSFIQFGLFTIDAIYSSRRNTLHVARNIATGKLFTQTNQDVQTKIEREFPLLINDRFCFGKLAVGFKYIYSYSISLNMCFILISYP